MGTPYNPERDPDNLFARPRLEQVAQLRSCIVNPNLNPNPGPVSVWSATERELPRKIRAADDFAWQDFLKAARAAVNSTTPPLQPGSPEPVEG